MTNPLQPRAGLDDPALDDVAEAARTAYRPRPRPGRVTYVVSTAEFEIEKISGVGLDLATVIESEVAAIHGEADWCRENGESLSLDDLAVWHKGKLLALVRPLADGQVLVLRFDGR